MNSNEFVGELEVCKMSMANAGLCFCMKKSKTMAIAHVYYQKFSINLLNITVK